MTLDDLEMYRILRKFRGISQIWEATTAKRMKIDPYRQRQYTCCIVPAWVLCCISYLADDESNSNAIILDETRKPI